MDKSGTRIEIAGSQRSQRCPRISRVTPVRLDSLRSNVIVGVRARCCTKYQKLVLKALQWWMPWPQEPIFLHLLEPETEKKLISKGLYVEQNTQI